MLRHFAFALAISFPFATGVFAQRTITVLADGSAEAAPELINLSMSVNTQATTATTLFQKHETEVERLRKALETAGIAAPNMTVKAYQLQPDFEYGIAGTRLTGYRVTTPIDVRLTDLKSLPRILDVASSSGASMVTIGGFGIRSRAQLEEAATRSALQHAKERAGELAKELGVTLGEVISVAEMEESGAMSEHERERAVRPDPLTEKAELKVVYSIK